MAEPTTAPLATVADLEAFWRPLNDDEKARAEDLINIASSRLRVIANNSGVDIDERIANDTTNNYAQVVEWVVLEAVKRALQTPVDSLPVDSYSQARPIFRKLQIYKSVGRPMVQEEGISRDRNIWSSKTSKRNTNHKE